MEEDFSDEPLVKINKFSKFTKKQRGLLTGLILSVLVIGALIPLTTIAFDSGEAQPDKKHTELSQAQLELQSRYNTNQNNADSNDKNTNNDKSGIEYIPLGAEIPDELQPHGMINFETTSLQINVENKYTPLTDGYPTEYPWIDAPIVEPYMDTRLTVSNAIDETGTEYEYVWNFGTGEKYYGTSITRQFKGTGRYSYTINEINVDSGKTSRVLDGNLICKYVRKELRNLVEEDKEAYLTAMHTLWTTPTDVGKEKYGDNYMSAEDFANAHLRLAGDRLCDHIHDGYGFFPQHFALDLKFEQALQAVDPSVSAHYWDFTIDIENIYTELDGDMENFSNSDIFTDKWFGNTDPSDGSILGSKWDRIEIPLSSGFGNSYNLMRAPWNANGSPQVTRSWTMCGIEGTTYWSMPGCRTHYDFVRDFDTWEEWGWSISYDPHGPLHIKVGGTFGCTDDIEKLYDLDLNDEQIEMIAAKSFQVLKNLWRNYYVECDSDCSWGEESTIEDQGDCTCSCVDEETFYQDDDGWELFLGLTALTEVIDPSFDENDRESFVNVMCSGNIMDGDQLEATSPYDPVFWPLHPTIERLWSYKMLMGGFTDDSWVDDDSSSLKSSCWGHSATDILPWQNIISGYDEPVLTNKEILSVADPRSDTLPFIYDSFAWAHCDQDFSDLESEDDVVPDPEGAYGIVGAPEKPMDSYMNPNANVQRKRK